MVREHLLWIDGQGERSAESILKNITDPFKGEVIARVHQANAEQMEGAISAAESASRNFRGVSRSTRSRLLSMMAADIEARRDEFVDLLVHEAGKPVTLSHAEVSRAVQTFTWAGEEAKRFAGDLFPMDVESGGRAFSEAQSHWISRGAVLGICPFNFPLNLVAHKVAPALAVGSAILIKAPPQAPGASVLIAEVFSSMIKLAGDNRDVIPPAALQVVHASNEVTAKAVADPRLAVLSFTGSDKVGWMLQAQAPRKKVALELGGNAAMIVHRDADIARAASRAAAGAFGYAGQTCISVQRIYVHEDVQDQFTSLLLKETEGMTCGDPSAKDVLVGPVIDSAAADRILSWIEAARQDGARLLTGGRREGNVIQPTVMTSVRASQKISCEEVFGPVVIVESYREFGDALKMVNESRFGLQAGVFTDSDRLIREAFSKLEVGAVVINEIPSFRLDHMPYGGVKDSGLGREGLRYAMEEFCERRTLIQWRG